MKLQPLSINGIEFDALLSENKTYSSEVPDYAVESGYSVSDNISIKPMELEITGHLTNTPVTWASHGTGRVEGVVAQLENLYHSKQLVTVVTSTDVYNDMAIMSLSVPKDESNKTSRDVRMTLKKITIVSAQSTTIPAAYIRGGDTGANAETSGTGSKGSASASGSGSSGSEKKESEGKASILYNLLN